MAVCATVGVFSKDGGHYFITGYWGNPHSEGLKLLEEMGYKLVSRRGLPSVSYDEAKILHWDDELKELKSSPKSNHLPWMNNFFNGVKASNVTSFERPTSYFVPVTFLIAVGISAFALMFIFGSCN